eukprot:jgi/Chlat1/7386/Chrsp6S07417
MAKRKDVSGDDGAEAAASGAEDVLEITPLGAGNEVGRSCVHMTFRGKTVLNAVDQSLMSGADLFRATTWLCCVQFDCGIHPAYSGLAALPYFDEIDPATIDVLLVTHFHLDHCASLPYFIEKTTFKGRVFMTHATKAIYRLLLADFLKITKAGVVDFHQQVEVDGIKFWCYTAGHVLGAAMFMVDIAGMKVLYTGDYSREEDRHLKAAELPEVSPDVCIIESTYGVQAHQPRRERERRFIELIDGTVRHGGRVLIPAFALGRAQELLLILEEHWETHPELHNIPIHFASPLASKCLTVYQTYISAMNDRIKRQFETSNPFEFKHVSSLKSIEHFDDVGPCVVMASPGMLQSGLSRQLFDMWCQDKKNACVIPGYVVEGTLAKTILSEPKEVTLSSGLVVPLHMRVYYISFSAHADYPQTNEFLSILRPPHIVLVHGEAREMMRLKAALTSTFASTTDEKQHNKHAVQVVTPKNCQTVRMSFKREKTAKVVGKLAESTPKDGLELQGLLVHKGFDYQLMDPEDLAMYTQLQTGTVTQRLLIPHTGPLVLLRRRIEGMFESVVLNTKGPLPALIVHECVAAYQQGLEHMVLEWNADPIADMVADSIIALVLQDAPTTSGVKKEEEDEEATELRTINALLRAMFGNIEQDMERKVFTVTVDGRTATIDHGSKAIQCADAALKEKLQFALRRLESSMYPIDVGC